MLENRISNIFINYSFLKKCNLRRQLHGEYSMTVTKKYSYLQIQFCFTFKDDAVQSFLICSLWEKTVDVFT